MRFVYFYIAVIIVLLVSGCSVTNNSSVDVPENDSGKIYKSVFLNLKQANTLAELPLACMQNEYPNKLGQTIGSEKDLGEPNELHPAFFGCFDWHSAVHGHWSLVRLLKEFPDLEKSEIIRAKLEKNISKENILEEVKYFQGEHNKSYERTYGWAWLLKLVEELHTWDDPLARILDSNMQPLTNLIVERYIDFLPKLLYPIRVGEHANTAFGLSFAWDYAKTVGSKDLKAAIESRARDFYFDDMNCPLAWEPSGFDFLSPCFEEIDLMRRVLKAGEFEIWMKSFAPQLIEKDFELKPGEVSDRSDDKLVHLDGLNFSRAWVFYGLTNQYPEYGHLVNIANEHMQYSLPNLVDDNYQGGHWLGSFAIYAFGELTK